MTKVFLGILCGLFLGQQAMAQTAITSPTVSGNWSLANAPYLIYNDITVPTNTTLTIEPGVEVVFMGNYLFSVNGGIAAVGTAEQPIIFRANDTTGWDDFGSLAGGWSGMNIGTQDQSGFNQPTFEYCVFRDTKSLVGGGTLSIASKEIYINECQFYKNYMSSVVSLASFGGTIKSKFKFTNNRVYNNYSITTMTTLATDSIIFSNNVFYNNQTDYGVYTNNTLDEDDDMVLLLQHNEFYNNIVSKNAGMVNCAAGGHAFVSNNKIHHNHTTMKGALSVRSKTAIVEKNLIVNNSRIQKEDFYCGINDGGGGLHLLGQTVISDVPGMSLYTVRNNIIANNHSDIDGGGIWVQHCKATIVNNTIVNNTSDEAGAGIHGWGSQCQLQIHNNIIHGNVSLVHNFDTGVYNFHFYTNTLNITNNLIDHVYSSPPPMAQGLEANTYDVDLTLSEATLGAGMSYNALLADFSPIQGSANVINQGNNTIADIGDTDYLNNPRIVDQTVDLGAIEFADKGNSTIELAVAKDLKMYPVPATDVLNIEHQGQQPLKAIRLFNSIGQELVVHWKDQQDRLQLDVKHLATGHYFVQLSFADGQKIAKAFVVQ